MIPTQHTYTFTDIPEDEAKEQAYAQFLSLTGKQGTITRIRFIKRGEKPGTHFITIKTVEYEVVL